MSATLTYGESATEVASGAPVDESVTMEQSVVLITGASAGIGRACADLLAERGWRVIGASRRASSGGAWESLRMDVTDDTSVATGVQEVIDRYGRLDAVVAAAGYGVAGAVELTTMAEAHAQFETNFFGVCRVVRVALPHLRRHGGRIVIIGSIGGLIGLPFQAYYSASKFALEGYAEALAYEVEPYAVDVTVIEPGNVSTEFTAKRQHVASTTDDPYAAASAQALGAMGRDESRGAEAQVVATTVRRVLEARRPPRRLTSGKAGERVGSLAKRLLPYRVFERGARRSLGL